MKRKFLYLAAVVGLLSPGRVLASGAESTILPSGLPHFLGTLASSVAFGIVGIVLAIIGFKLFDLVTPFDLEKEMCERKNIAVGILCAAIVLGICHIIAASIG